MKTPWQEYPHLWPNAPQWKTGDESAFLNEWLQFFDKLSESEKDEYIKENKAPFYWFYFYLMKNENLIAWHILFVVLIGLTHPLRRMQFKKSLKIVNTAL